MHWPIEQRFRHSLSISDEGILYSCGMHLLACPDIEYIGPRDTLAATARCWRVNGAARPHVGGALWGKHGRGALDQVWMAALAGWLWVQRWKVGRDRG